MKYFSMQKHVYLKSCVLMTTMHVKNSGSKTKSAELKIYLTAQCGFTTWCGKGQVEALMNSAI
jgi:hypothetical protein